MNTPRKKKRFTRHPIENWESGTWAGVLSDPDYQAALGRIASSYEHLETAMTNVFAALMGSSDVLAAGYVYRSLRNPSIKGQLMWHLLEVAPHNKDTPEWFDDVLKAHNSIRSRRNEYVHG